MPNLELTNMTNYSRPPQTIIDTAGEGDMFEGHEITTHLPKSGDLIKIKFNKHSNDIDKEFLYCKVKEIVKYETGSGIDYDNSIIECEMCIHQYFENTRNYTSYEKYNTAQSYVLSWFSKWKIITDAEYLEINNKFENSSGPPMLPQPEPLLARDEGSPLTSVATTTELGGRRRSNRKHKRKSRKSKRNSRKSRRSRR